jgi:hypothetical protein
MKEFEVKLRVSESALALVRAEFNPSHSTEVGRIKQMCAALITFAEDLRERPLPGEATGMTEMKWEKDVAAQRQQAAMLLARRNCSIAITHLEEAAMHLVKAATA